MSRSESTQEERPGGDSVGRPAAPSRSGAFPSPKISTYIARVELVRDLRWLRAQDYVLAGAVVITVLSLPGLWFLYQISRDVGAALVTGNAPVSGMWQIFAVGWLFTAGILLADGMGDNGIVSNEGALLAMRPPKDVAGAMLLAETIKIAPYVVIPLVIAYLGLSIGAGTPRPLIGGFAVGLVALLTAGCIGYPLGVALQGVVRRYRHLSAIKPIAGILLFVVYLVVIFTGETATVVASVAPTLAASPVHWLGDLAFLTTPGVTTTPVHAAAVVAVAGVICPIGVWGTVLAARFTWYVDRAETGTGSDEPTDVASSVTTSWGTRSLSLVCRTPGTLGVAKTTLVRSYRAPRLLAFGAIPLVGSIPLFEQLFATGSVPWYAPWLVIGYGGWITGLAFTANVLGNQGQTLPLLLTARTTGKEVVIGSVIAGAIPAVPVVSVSAVGAALLANRSPSVLLRIGLAAPVVVIASAILATGIGTAFPRFETMRVSSSKETLPPSKYSLTLYSVAISSGVFAAAALVDETVRLVGSVLLSSALPFGLTVGSGPLQLLSLGVLFLLAAAVPGSYLYAVLHIDGYSIE